MKDKFEEKWKEFCEFEGTKFEGIDRLLYLKRQNLFLFRTEGKYIQMRISSEELRNKMISISIVKGKDENSN